MSKMYYMIKCMSLWNKIKENIVYFCHNLYYFYVYMMAYVKDYHNKWIFIPGHTLPITQYNLNNTIQNKWSYYSTTNALHYKDCNTTFKLSWLSAKIIITPNEEIAYNSMEYNIDDFINTFSVSTKTHRTPTLAMIFIAWCITTKQWFALNNMIEFHIIDDQGEEHILSLYIDNECLHISNNKLYSIKN